MKIALLCGLQVLFVTSKYLPSEMCKKKQDGKSYNLWTLRNDDKNFEVSSAENLKYYLNMCGSLVDSDERSKTCDKDQGACFVNLSNNETKNLGFAAEDSLTLESDGVFKYSLKGGDYCGEGKRKSTEIYIHCYRGVSPPDAVPVLDEQNECETKFIWKTPNACGISERQDKNDDGPINCGYLKDPNSDKYYNLTYLSRPKSDFYDRDKNGIEYYINICRDLNSVPNTEVAPGSGAAKTNSKVSPPKFDSLGLTSTQKLTFHPSGDGIVYEMTDGYPCSGSLKPARIKVDIMCDSNGSIGGPKFVSFDEANCAYNFLWKSKYGCPYDPKKSSCVVEVPEGHVDLNPLRKTQGNYEINNGKSTIQLNVCGPLNIDSRNKCNAEASICEISNNQEFSFSLGDNPYIEAQHGGITLKYDDGDFCDNGERRKSTVRFLCDPNSFGHPALVDETHHCIFNFEWKTSAACPVVASGKSVGATVFWVFFSLFLIYLALGILYKRFILNTRGWDQIPNINFWQKVWSFITCQNEARYEIRL
jgi:hypothetical protein